MTANKFDRKQIMRRAWSLTRQAMRPFSRALFAGFLRRAWDEARNAPVTPWLILQRWAVVSIGSTREEVIRQLQLSLACAQGQADKYIRCRRPVDAWARQKRSDDIMRMANIEACLFREIAARDAHAA